MLRISQLPGREARARRLCLEGQVTGPWVEELRRVCLDVLGTNGMVDRQLVLDLADVSFLDSDGVALFRELAGRGVVFAHGSPFIAEQLRGVADVDG